MSGTVIQPIDLYIQIQLAFAQVVALVDDVCERFTWNGYTFDFRTLLIFFLLWHLFLGLIYNSKEEYEE